MNEYLAHIGIGHASPKNKDLFSHISLAGDFLGQVTLAQSIHHGLVKSTFKVGSLTEQDRARADQIVDRATVHYLVEKMISERYPNLTVAEINSNIDSLRSEVRGDPQFDLQLSNIRQSLRKGNYGVDVTPTGTVSLLTLDSPWYLLNFGVYAATGNFFI